MRNVDHLITINLGLGRDSIAMLCLLKEHALVCAGLPLMPWEVDAVIFSDTGEEWDHTYAQVKPVEDLCDSMGVRVLLLRKPSDKVWQANLRDKGSRDAPRWVADAELHGLDIEGKAASGAYHMRLPIMDEFERFAKIAVTVNASCTDNHKVSPIRRCINDLSIAKFGLGNRQWSTSSRKGERPRHEVLIGIAADELERAIDTGRPAYEQVRYPLVEMGIAKDDEAPILERHGFGAVRKSGCVMCPYQGVGWFWALRETAPERWVKVVAYEAKALAENPKMFVSGRSGMPLPQAVDRWRALNPKATLDDVLDKAYSRCRAPIPDGRQLDMWDAP